MLAYVFWHWKSDAVSFEAYEELSRSFHSSFRNTPPKGFLQSYCFALGGAPWVPDSRAAFEDWYLIEDSSGLDPLDRAAIDELRRAQHDSVARAVEAGAGGLYRLKRGAPLVESASLACWFSKPRGISYAELDGWLEPVLSGGRTALWQRQMVLGPAPEFCLHAAGNLALPQRLRPLRIPLRAIWPL